MYSNYYEIVAFFEFFRKDMMSILQKILFSVKRQRPGFFLP